MLMPPLSAEILPITSFELSITMSVPLTLNASPLLVPNISSKLSSSPEVP